MRTFHIGGAAQRGAEQSSVEAGSDAKVRIANRNVVLNSDGVPVVMGRNLEVVLLDEKGRDRARYRVPYGAKLLVDEGAEVQLDRKSTRLNSSPSCPARTPAPARKQQ